MNNGQLRAALTRSNKIVFVCSGNIIRSAYADLLCRHSGVVKEVFSVGTTYPNTEIHPNTAQQLRTENVSEELIKSFTPKLVHDVYDRFDESTVVFVMTKQHKKEFVKHHTKTKVPNDKVFLLMELLGEKDKDIKDPYWSTNFTETFTTIKQCIDVLLKNL